MTSWHTLTADEVSDRLDTDKRRGLGEEEASRRLGEHGPNEIRSDEGPGTLTLLARQLRSALVWLLLVAAVISGALLDEWIDAGVIAAIVVLNTVLGFLQEARAEQALARLREMAAPEAVLVREGREVSVPTREVVPGDLIILEAGVLVAADARVAEAIHLEVDEASLTGESLPVAKAADPVEHAGSLGDRTSMVFAGTTIASGRGAAIVVATGPSTEFGRIAESLAEEEPPTPLQVELDSVGKRLAAIAVATAGIVFLAGWWRGNPAEAMFLTAVALAVAAIPEGLPAVVTITLSRGVQRMAKRNAIVRRLPAVEALGSASVICTDKTGTLTQNRLEVQEVLLADLRLAPRELDPGDRRSARFFEIAALCSDARKGKEGWIGDPTELAVVRAAVAGGADPDGIRERAPRVDEHAFDSRRKRMSTVHDVGDGYLVAVKGAPEVVLERCDRIETAGGPAPLADDRRQADLDVATGLAEKGWRTLALAYRHSDEMPSEAGDAESGLVLVAMVGMSDAVRPEALPAVEEARRAGIRVVMVTGDHAVTAEAVATDVGIIESGGAVMGGDRLREQDAEELAADIDRYRVFSRIDPLDKVKIVEAWRRRGEIVAMTGDGVNDAPALRSADIGVAMGSGTDVAKEASSIVLADDNFASIVAAVREGRTIFGNLKRVVWYLLACNASEVFVMFVGFLVWGGLGEPLLATQLLWMNLVTDGLPALALGVDPATEGVMDRPPEPAHGVLQRWGLLASRGAILASAALGALLLGHYVLSSEWPVVRTMIFTTLVLVQLVHAYEVRARVKGTPNRLLLWSLAGSTALHAAVVYTPFGQVLFETEPLGVAALGVTLTLVAAAGLVQWIVERTRAGASRP
ncbi:MAG TPA: cation-translocating P-type ATPase [Acidimicrobiia bacterium]|nr:cation-translocating P-type ATPase [Acidimicrobiia bacterium]